MKRIAKAAAWLILTSMIALAPFLAASLTAAQENPVQKKYYSWTGVLRLWKCEGWQSGNGSLTAWLNACIEVFEKRHPGVYVQLTDVSEETMRNFGEGSVNPPDMILYAPGMLDVPYSLIELEESLPVKDSLNRMGIWQGKRYAVPVALGGYALAINTQLLPETPDDWSALTEAAGNRGKTADVLNAPADGAFRSWSAALISLFAGSYGKQAGSEPAPVGEGMDLGLEKEKDEPTRMPEVNQNELLPNALPGVLPESFRTVESVYSQFTAGQIAVMPVTQREIRRLQMMSETGKGPDWRIETIGRPMTDQAALISVVAWPRSDAQERQLLCVELMSLMLSEQMQQKLTLSRAFSVIDQPPLYGANRGMSGMETALNDGKLLVPPAFGHAWREYAKQLMDGIGAGGQTQAAYGLLEEMMGQ